MVIEQKVLTNVWFGDNVGIWEDSIVYKVLYLEFEVEAIVNFVTGFLVVMEIFIEVPNGNIQFRGRIRHGCGV